MTTDRNHTFSVSSARFMAELESVETTIKLRLPAGMFIPFATGSGRGAYGVAVNRVILQEWRSTDDDGIHFDVELKGNALTKAGHIDKRGGGDYHYAWVDTAEDVERLMAALPEDMTALLLNGSIIGFTKEQVAAVLDQRVARKPGK